MSETDLQQIPELKHKYDDLKQKVGPDSGLAIAMENLDLDLITKALALAEKSPNLDVSKATFHEADILTRNLKFKATFEAALASSPDDLSAMVDVITENATLVRDEDKRANIIGETEAEVSTRVQTLLLQELAGATESKDKRKVEEALRLASLLHDFDGKSDAVAKAQTVTQMNMRTQAIWDTSRTTTTVRDENTAFDPWSEKKAVENAPEPTAGSALALALQRGLDIINGGAVGNVEEDMRGVVLAMNDLSKDWRPGDDKISNRVKSGSVKLMEMTGGDNSIENFPHFAHILEALKVLDYSDCKQLSGTYT